MNTADGLGHAPFARENLIPERHQGISHVRAYAGHQMDSPVKQHPEEPGADVTLVGMELAEEVSDEDVSHRGFLSSTLPLVKEKFSRLSFSLQAG